MKKYAAVFFVSFSLLLTNAAMAAKIAVVKNKKVLLNLDGDSASPGTEFFAINPQGKKVAIIRITQVKGNRALGDILKGNAKPGYTTQPRGGGAAQASTSSAEGDDPGYYDKKLSQRSHNGNSFGVVGGYLMNSMSANFTPFIGATYKAQPTMSGSGFGALGFYDYALGSSFVARAMVGVEQYKVSGSIDTTDCSGTTLCSVDLNYLSMYGYGRWNFLQGKYKAWIGGGAGYLYAMGKASTFLRSDQISANQIFVLSAGVDVRLSAKNYIPVSLEYGMFPASDSVTASIIYLRAGYAWNQ